MAYVPSPLTKPRDTSPLTEDVKRTFLVKAEELASEGLRVIALAQRTIDCSDVKNISREDAEKDLTFMALAGIFDPPRPESAGAVRACRAAGIIVHM